MKLSYWHWVVLCLLATVVWGTTFPIMKQALSAYTPISLIAFRFAIASLALGAYIHFSKEKLTNYDITRGAILGVIFFLGFLFQITGFIYTSATSNAFITGLYVVLVPIFSSAFLKKFPSNNVIFSCILAIFGLYLLSGFGAALNIGDAIAFAGTIMWSIHILAVSKFTKNAGTVGLTFSQLATVALIGSVLTVFLGEFPATITAESISIPIYLGLFATAAAFLIQIGAQKVIEPSKVSLIFVCEVAFAAIFAYFLLGETLSLLQLSGAILMFAAMLLSEFGK